MDPALAGADAKWKDTVWELIVESYVFWAEVVFGAEDYWESAEEFKEVISTIGKLVKVAGDKVHKSALRMFECAAATKETLHALMGLGSTGREIIAADKDLEHISALKRATVQWGSCEKVADINGKHRQEMTKCCLKLTDAVQEPEKKLLSVLQELEQRALTKLEASMSRLKPMAWGMDNGSSWRHGFDGDWDALLALARSTLFESLDPEELLATASSVEEVCTWKGQSRRFQNWLFLVLLLCNSEDVAVLTKYLCTRTP